MERRGRRRGRRMGAPRQSAQGQTRKSNERGTGRETSAPSCRRRPGRALDGARPAEGLDCI
eukprot:1402311-Pyramimonas_sp.AAC.1